MEKKTGRHVEEASQKILAIETSSASLGVAAGEVFSDKWVLRSEFFLNAGLKHAEKLQPVCQDQLVACGWTLQDLTAIAVDVGPGSFTGIRVGVSFARTLAQSLNIPLAAFTAFEVLAEDFWQKSPESKTVCAAVPSIGDEAFATFLFRRRSVDAQKSARIWNLAKLKSELARNSTALAVPQSATSLVPHFPSANLTPLPARHLLSLYAARYPRGARGSWKQVQPFYMRPSIAEERASSAKQEKIRS